MKKWIIILFLAFMAQCSPPEQTLGRGEILRRWAELSEEGIRFCEQFEGTSGRVRKGRKFLNYISEHHLRERVLDGVMKAHPQIYSIYLWDSQSYGDGFYPYGAYVRVNKNNFIYNFQYFPSNDSLSKEVIQEGSYYYGSLEDAEPDLIYDCSSTCFSEDFELFIGY